VSIWNLVPTGLRFQHSVPLKRDQPIFLMTFIALEVNGLYGMEAFHASRQETFKERHLLRERQFLIRDG